MSLSPSHIALILKLGFSPVCWQTERFQEGGWAFKHTVYWMSIEFRGRVHPNILSFIYSLRHVILNLYGPYFFCRNTQWFFPPKCPVLLCPYNENQWGKTFFSCLWSCNIWPNILWLFINMTKNNNNNKNNSYLCCYYYYYYYYKYK